MRCLMAGDCIAVVMAASSLSTIGFGVPFGTEIPDHDKASNPLYPDSEIVGTSGYKLLRCRLVTASGLICVKAEFGGRGVK
jgi:hypothetical protein